MEDDDEEAAASRRTEKEFQRRSKFNLKGYESEIR